MDNENKAKNLGIWMDHSSAHLMEFTTDPIVTKIILSDFTDQEKSSSLQKNERIMHNKQQHMQSEYYQKLIDVIKNYEEVILFGPTHAKVELFNLIKADHLIDKTNVTVQNADKMTDNQQHAFVKNHFANH